VLFAGLEWYPKHQSLSVVVRWRVGLPGKGIIYSFLSEVGILLCVRNTLKCTFISSIHEHTGTGGSVITEVGEFFFSNSEKKEQVPCAIARLSSIL